MNQRTWYNLNEESHAVSFVGEKEAGKTAFRRRLARDIYLRFPYKESRLCLDFDLLKRRNEVKLQIWDYTWWIPELIEEHLSEWGGPPFLS